MAMNDRLVYSKVSIFCLINVTSRPRSDTGLQTTFNTVLTSLRAGKDSLI